MFNENISVIPLGQQKSVAYSKRLRTSSLDIRPSRSAWKRIGRLHLVINYKEMFGHIE